MRRYAMFSAAWHGPEGWGAYMKRRTFIAALGGAARGRSQQPLHRIAYLTPSKLNPTFVKVFKDALRDLG